MVINKKKGEGYIDVCVGVVCFVMVIVIAINIFSFITLRLEMDEIADRILEAATFSGEFGSDFEEADDEMYAMYDWYNIDWGADEWYNQSLERVQLGDRMWVSISVRTYVKGLGAIKIPVKIVVTRTGLSERYWK